MRKLEKKYEGEDHSEEQLHSLDGVSVSASRLAPEVSEFDS